MATKLMWEELDSASRESVDSEVRKSYTALCMRIDGYFAWLMTVQWIAAVWMAALISPRSWAGDTSFLHPHVKLAFFYGGVLTLVPVALTRLAPGERITRLTIAGMQMLMSSLLIHLTGGRIETHFHIFGSLAFLAFYLDWEVLAMATAVVGIDHVLRGIFLPYSVFGSYTVEPWRWMEHIGWVLFCDVFLVAACVDRRRRIRELATRHVERGELLHSAYHDALTGLPNRSFLSQRMAEALAGSSPDGNEFGVLYIDLDRFKDVNERMGHAGGDVLLQSMAARVDSWLAEGELLARVGGDEFIALIPVPKGETGRLEEVSRAILHSLLQPFEVNGEVVAVGASIGISRFPADGESENELLTKSDQAMYRVKATGRDGYLFYAPELFEEREERLNAERRMHRAIAAGEFAVSYQPIFHARGELAGFEALLRWFDPELGPISPTYFIPLAEESGLIVELGNFVLREVCRQSAQWRQQGLFEATIAVNVSSLQLGREDFAEEVMRNLAENGVPPEALELEVTESVLMKNVELADLQIQELRRRGIRISIDDFGTGYSSLGRLRQLKLDTLKIDRLFIEGTADSEPDRMVVQHIIGMAHSLGMSVVAEGVETEAQLEVLRTLGCDLVQGFLLGRPAGKDETERLLQKWLTLEEAKSLSFSSIPIERERRHEAAA